MASLWDEVYQALDVIFVPIDPDWTMEDVYDWLMQDGYSDEEAADISYGWAESRGYSLKE